MTKLSFCILLFSFSLYIACTLSKVIPNSITFDNSIRREVVNNNSDVHWFYDDERNLIKPNFEVSSLTNDDPINVENSVFFTLYTKENPEGESLFVYDVEQLNTTKFDPKYETIFITHGWFNSAKSRACTLIRDAYLQMGNYNVIVVDWSKTALRSYGFAASHVKKIGQYIATMIDFLETQGMDISKLKLIGHSLGAHVMGSAGYHAKNIINYVVGLDPTLPHFNKAQPGTRISTHDAKNVEVIHTNGGNLGFFRPVGHVDFYPNGGKTQVGCLESVESACSHSRSYELYAESITSDIGFYGRHCANYTMMAVNYCLGSLQLMGGLKNELHFRGVYLLQTRDTEPFAMGQV